MGGKGRVVRGEGILPFISEEVEGDRAITSYAGLPLVAEAYRACGASDAVRRSVVTRQRYRERGLSDEQLVESFCLLLAVWAEPLDDFEQVAKEALATLPKGLERIYFRSDTAGYTHDLLNWLRAGVEGGPHPTQARRAFF